MIPQLITALLALCLHLSAVAPTTTPIPTLTPLPTATATVTPSPAATKRPALAPTRTPVAKLKTQLKAQWHCTPPLSAAAINSILQSRHSPAWVEDNNVGQHIYERSAETCVPDDLMVAIWGKENQFGTDGSGPARYHNPGNLAASKGCGSHCWRYFDTWYQGIDAEFDVLGGYRAAGSVTAYQIAVHYAPPSDLASNVTWPDDVERIRYHLLHWK